LLDACQKEADELKADAFPNSGLERPMGEVIRFIPKSELERARLIREARATYERIFPTADPITEQRDTKE